MGLSACNSSGHLSNHADIAPSHAGITFAISNTLVRLLATWHDTLGKSIDALQRLRLMLGLGLLVHGIQ